MSLDALEALMACEVVDRDRHGRIVAKVFSPNGVDVGRRLVAAGWALAYRRYSKDYVDAEDEAERPDAGCGGAPSSNPGRGASQHRRGGRTYRSRLQAPALERWVDSGRARPPSVAPLPDTRVKPS